ncbi:MAG: N-formylglutamate amidohydrolase [Candidatus Paceibacterota bacterium]
MRTNTLPLIAHVPHGAVFIPKKGRRGIILNNADLARELVLMTDRFTPHLFSGIAARGGLMFVNNLNRLVVDPERFENDKDEPMSKKGMGAVYVKTAYQETLRREMPASEREKMILEYYRPYHQVFAKLTQKTLARFGQCLIIDCHSFPSKPLPYEFDQSTNRPDICLGTDKFHTPKKLITAIFAFFQKNKLSVAQNTPFSGTYVPLPYYKKNKNVRSIMIEINRAAYMDETTGKRNQKYRAMEKSIDELIKIIIQIS